MKHILLPLAITSVVLFAACSEKKDTTARDMILLTDSSHNSNLLTDTGAGQAIAEPQAPEETAPPVKTNVQGKNKTKPRPVYNNNATTQAPVATPEPSQPTVTPAPSTETAGTGAGTQGNTSEGNSTATPAKKKGVSNAAKGAIIGGVGGAVAGAVIGKNGKGAVIGGVVGAAGGYILGKKKDKKQADTSNN